MKDSIKIGKNIFPTLFALTLAEQEKGLMGAEWPPPVMTFVYAGPRLNAFWMKNTISPLDIIFCLAGKIIAINRGLPHSTAIIGGHEPSDLVIELPAGTCEDIGIKVGDVVELNYSKKSQMKAFLAKSGFNF